MHWKAGDEEDFSVSYYEVILVYGYFGGKYSIVFDQVRPESLLKPWLFCAFDINILDQAYFCGDQFHFVNSSLVIFNLNTSKSDPFITKGCDGMVGVPPS